MICLPSFINTSKCNSTKSNGICRVLFLDCKYSTLDLCNYTDLQLAIEAKHLFGTGKIKGELSIETESRRGIRCYPGEYGMQICNLQWIDAMSSEDHSYLQFYRELYDYASNYLLYFQNDKDLYGPYKFGFKVEDQITSDHTTIKRLHLSATFTRRSIYKPVSVNRDIFYLIDNFMNYNTISNEFIEDMDWNCIPPVVYYNTEITLECPPPSTGTPVTILAGAYSSLLSQAHADQLALNAAQSQISCTPPTYYSAQQTLNCPPPSVGAPVVVPAGAYTSIISQADADNQAYNYGVSQLSCTPVLTWKFCTNDPTASVTAAGWCFSNNVAPFINSIPNFTSLDIRITAPSISILAGSNGFLGNRPIYLNGVLVATSINGSYAGPIIIQAGDVLSYGDPACY